jgi:ABC-type uncharacterized transport system fused permease/ATPase subunit
MKLPDKASKGDTSHQGLLRQMVMITRAIFASPVGKTLWLLVAAVVLIIIATAYGQIRLNRWNKPSSTHCRAATCGTSSSSWACSS